MTPHRHLPRFSLHQVASIGSMVIMAGVFLFAHVWWPIQSERALFELRRMEKEVSARKAEVQVLTERYENLTSLSSLDDWAKTHGPWKTPRDTDVITISN